MKKCAIITGVYGQDGSLLAEYLLAKRYRVVGLVPRIKEDFHGLESVEIIEADISDPPMMLAVFQDVRPDECYHLAAVHHSSEQKMEIDVRAKMLRVNFLSTQAILDALLEKTPHCRFLYAGSSQMHTPGKDITVVDENTPYRPNSYYGFTKVASANLIDLLRRERGLWGVTAILFNHESARRSAQFLSRRVTCFAAAARKRKNETPGYQPEVLHVRDIWARADWSSATDFVRAFHLSLQADSAMDYVMASGKVRTVRELLEEAFQAIGLDWLEFVDAEQLIHSDLQPCLRGDPQRAMRNLGWTPQKSFSDLIQEMVTHDFNSINTQT